MTNEHEHPAEGPEQEITSESHEFEEVMAERTIPSGRRKKKATQPETPVESGAEEKASEDGPQAATVVESEADAEVEARADAESASEEQTEQPGEEREAPKLERLQKILAQAGIASRRHAEELITEGRVQVNGQTVSVLGTKADPERDHIRVDGKLLRGAERLRYFMLNKPRGYVTTVTDPEGRPTVMEFFAKSGERLYPVGRLDYLSEGLLLVTNDGELANKLTRAASGVEKTYLVKIAGNPGEDELERLRGGLAIDKGRPLEGKVHTAPARVRQVRKGDNPWFEVVLIEGRNRELRKMFEEIGHHVEKIRRVGYGPLVLDVEPGKIRELDTREVDALRLTAEGKLKPRRPKASNMLPKDAGKSAEDRDKRPRRFDRRPERAGGEKRASRFEGREPGGPAERGERKFEVRSQSGPVDRGERKFAGGRQRGSADRPFGTDAGRGPNREEAGAAFPGRPKSSFGERPKPGFGDRRKPGFEARPKFGGRSEGGFGRGERPNRAGSGPPRSGGSFEGGRGSDRPARPFRPSGDRPERLERGSSGRDQSKPFERGGEGYRPKGPARAEGRSSETRGGRGAQRPVRGERAAGPGFSRRDEGGARGGRPSQSFGRPESRGREDRGPRPGGFTRRPSIEVHAEPPETEREGSRGAGRPADRNARPGTSRGPQSGGAARGFSRPGAGRREGSSGSFRRDARPAGGAKPGDRSSAEGWSASRGGRRDAGGPSERGASSGAGRGDSSRGPGGRGGAGSGSGGSGRGPGARSFGAKSAGPKRGSGAPKRSSGGPKRSGGGGPKRGPGGPKRGAGGPKRGAGGGKRGGSSGGGRPGGKRSFGGRKK